MKLFKPTRFSLRTMLLAVAVVAVTAYSIREWMLLRDAREQFNYALAGWDFSRVTAENVVLASRRLMKAEADTPWISDRTARQRHLERLNRLLQRIESPTRMISSREVDEQGSLVRREIER